ncbi:hypothetical protein Poly51_46880 [Rubripirellula tenax]|uniref:YhaN AAA domain-containing protein n=1 Tax=Rubripirellula tenax TaxID=2528015 RepID=A0A5C6EJQ8_9BACT|nr:YhaN family protein [Rubripirellula tenax]TWU48784.1 hypothetical protein Poly51_46880 [Rubripirellula tenax]
MRIRRLDLIRIGPFTNRALTFEQGEYGFHLIYGPNEGGKSSSLRALKQWLFGIRGERSCRDDFVHTHNELRIGGVIEADNGERLHCIRRKGGAKSLRDANDKAIIEPDRLSDFLHRITQDQFETQFGIDLQQLVSGGHAIVAGGGDVGGSLFAAGAGAASVGAVGKWVDGECERLLKSSGTRPAINAALIAYNEAQKVVSEKSTPSKQWQSLNDSLESTIAKRRELDESIVRLESQRERLNRISHALPTISSLKDSRNALTEVADAPRLRKDFANVRIASTSALAAAESTLALAQQELVSVDARIKTLDVPQSLLDHASAIGNLYKNHERYLDWVRTCPELKSERKSLEARTERALRELGRDPKSDDADDVRIGTANRVQIHELAEQRLALMQSVLDAEQELSEKQRTLETIQSELSELPPAVDVRSLRLAIDAALKMGDCESQLLTKESKLSELADRGIREINRLPLWQGSIEELESLPVPSIDSVARFESEIRVADQSITQLRAESEDLEDKIADAQSQLSKLQLNQDVPTEGELDQVRSERDASWAVLSAAFDAAGDKGSRPEERVIAQYEALVRKSDELSDRLRREGERVAEKTRWIADSSRWKQSLEQRRTRLASAEADRQNTVSDWRELWLLANIDPISPVEMRQWLDQYRKLCELAVQIREQSLTCDHDRESIQQHRTELANQLSQRGIAVDSAASLASLLDMACDRCKAFEAVESRRGQWTERVGQVKHEHSLAKKRLDEAEARKTLWQSQWRDAVQVLDGNADLTATQAMAMLQAIDQVVVDIDQAAELTRRWTNQHDQIEAYDESVASLIERLGLELGDISVHQTVTDLHDRLVRAREQKATRDSLMVQRDGIEKQFSLARQSISAETAILEDLCAEARCNSVDDLLDVERGALRRIAIEQDIATFEKQIRQWTQGTDLDSFITEAEAEDPDSLSPRMAQLVDEIDDAKSRREAYSESIGGQQTDLDRIDGSAEATKANEDAEVALTQVRDHAEEYCRMKLASVILKRAVKRYREQNQGPVLQRASELFAELTLGAFRGLRSDYSDAGEPVLVGVRGAAVDSNDVASESLVTVDGMSEGTCDQLFLSLRIASLELYLERNPPVPFVVDDILVKFDDARSAAALRVLAALSKKTQVIMFTHHQHLIDVARQSVAADALFVQSLDDSYESVATASPDQAKSTVSKSKPVPAKPAKKKRAEKSGKNPPPVGELF